tara:strand:- start:285 stop:419 length:135 start_codon:yes stop_codon:yes gene_type:complete
MLNFPSGSGSVKIGIAQGSNIEIESQTKRNSLTGKTTLLFWWSL